MFVFSLGKRRIKISFGFCMALLLLFLLSKEKLLSGFLCCLLHECGHLLVCALTRLPVKELTFAADGLSLSLEKPPQLLPLGKELLLQSGGILATVIAVPLFFTLGKCAPDFTLYAQICLCLTVFHLIPARGLDGGRMWKLVGERFIKAQDLTLWEWLGQGIAFAIFVTAAILALSLHETMFALSMGLCCVCFVVFGKG